MEKLILIDVVINVYHGIVASTTNSELGPLWEQFDFNRTGEVWKYNNSCDKTWN